MNGEIIKKLEARIAQLESKQKLRDETQLTYPLDNPSRQIVQLDALILTGAFEDGGAPYTNTGILQIRINGQNYNVMTA